MRALFTSACFFILFPLNVPFVSICVRSSEYKCSLVLWPNRANRWGRNAFENQRECNSPLTYRIMYGRILKIYCQRYRIKRDHARYRSNDFQFQAYSFYPISLSLSLSFASIYIQFSPIVNFLLEKSTPRLNFSCVYLGSLFERNSSRS